MIKPPARLFKYEPICPQSLENLKNQVVFFGNPRNFNDPYDCAIIPKISIPRADELRFWRQRHNNETRVKDASDDVLRGSTIVAAHNVFVKAIAEAENIGITCFSECCDILLLWSHYASKGSGFCLEFKTDADSMFEKAFPVSYVDAFPCISAMATVLKNVDILTALYRTKSKDWEYEKEWRIIHGKVNNAYTYRRESLSAVYFGSEAKAADIDNIRQILQHQNPEVVFYQGVRSQTDFRINFQSI